MEHEHCHALPVEWEYFIIWGEIERHPTNNIPPAFKRVTKLRCLCGDEIDRKAK